MCSSFCIGHTYFIGKSTIHLPPICIVRHKIKAKNIITILKPFHVLIDMPCEVCNQKITDWTGDKVIGFATGLGWAHEECRKTLTGKMKQLGIITTYIPRVEEKPSQPKEKETEKPPAYYLQLNS